MPQGKLNAIAEVFAVHYPVKVNKRAELMTAAKENSKPCHYEQMPHITFKNEEKAKTQANRPGGKWSCVEVLTHDKTYVDINFISGVF